MKLPNYFLADLPPEATLTGEMLVEASRTLKRNREQYLSGRSTLSLMATLAEAASLWRSPEYSLRQLALAADPNMTGFPPATLARGLDTFFGQVSLESLQKLVLQEVGHARRLDDFCAVRAEHESDRAAMARGPEYVVHIAAGNLPVPVFASMILSVLTRSAQLVKCASGASLLPRLFAHSLYEVDPKLGACLEVAEWPGGTGWLEEPLFREADVVTATGTDETLGAIRLRLPARVRFLGYGHRVSFGYITREALSPRDLSGLVARATVDVTAWNQAGCLSPHLFYVERHGRISSEDFAERLADQLSQVEETEPRGAVCDAEAAVIANRRAFYGVRAAHSSETRLWSSPQSTAWTVVHESDPRFQLSCLNRFVYVKPVTDVREALEAADAVRGMVSTVGVEPADERSRDLAMALARWGVTRLCPLGTMQTPPLLWRHDGHPALGDLVTWTDWEMPPQS